MSNASNVSLLVLLSVLLSPAFAQSLSDPTVPPSAQVQADPKVKRQVASPVVYRVSYIKVAKHGSVAKVNDAWVTEGDRVGGYRVREIRDDQVVLISGSGTVRVLSLTKNSVKKTY